MKPKYTRVLIKLSGGALGGADCALDQAALGQVADMLLEIRALGVQLGVVLGGGNILRGRSAQGMNRNIADNMGMLATVINSLALQDALERRGAKCTTMSAIEMYAVCDAFAQRHAVKLLEAGEIVIFAGGTGHPFISTDTAAALRGAQIGAQALLMAKNVDGVYECDPSKNPGAKKFDSLTYDEILTRNLEALDMTAVSMCKAQRLPVIVFGLAKPENLRKAVLGEKIGTIIT